MLDLEELRQLAAFARWGTLSRAAEELHISQPTLSRTMQSLEEEFGVKLFRYEGRQLSLTPAGREYAQTVLRPVYRAEEQALARTLERFSPQFVEAVEALTGYLTQTFQEEIFDRFDRKDSK